MSRTTFSGPVESAGGFVGLENGPYFGDAFNEVAGASGLRPSRQLIATAGDSRPASAVKNDGGVVLGYRMEGFPAWLRQITRQRFSFPLANSFAVGASTTNDLVATQLPQVLASNASSVLLLTSTNDRTATNPAISYQQTIANLETFISQVTAAGKNVDIIAELPRGGAGGSRLAGTALTDHLRVHRWLQRQAHRPLVTVTDLFAAFLADPLTASGVSVIDVNNLLCQDNLHPGGRGAHQIAKALQPIYEARFPAVDILPQSNGDLWSADNPSGSLTPNPMMAGTSGTVTAPGAGTLTGTCAGTVSGDGRVRLTNGTGLTVAASVVTAGGKRWQQFVISGTPTSAGALVEFNHFATYSVDAGDTVEAVAEYEVDAGQTGINAIQLLVTTIGGTNTYVDGQVAGATTNFPVEAVSGVLNTPAFVSPASGTGTTDTVQVAFIQNVAVSATVRVRALSVRKVI